MAVTQITASERARVQKYLEAGQLPISSGFLQRLFENGGQGSEQPILQIHNMRYDQKDGYCARLRLCDGKYTYSACYFPPDLLEKLQADGIPDIGQEVEDPNGFPVIRINQLSFSDEFSLKGKTPVYIKDYEFLCNCQKVPGVTLPSPEDLVAMRGFRPSPVFAPISIDKENGPPPPKKAHTGSAPPPPSRSTSGGILPIGNITPYISKWRILGTCTAKEDLKTIQSHLKGPLKVFNFELTDEKGSSIRISAFSEQAERISTQVQVRCSYYLSNCTVRVANKRFNSTGHDYELTIRSADDLQPALDAPVKAPAIALRTVPLNKVAQHAGCVVDVLAVVDKVNPVNEFVAKSGTECVKREIQLIDKSCTVVTLVLWSAQAREFDEDARGHAIGIKGAMVREFNGSFTINGGSRLEMDPPITDVAELLEWFERDRAKLETTTISQTGGGAGALDRDWRFLQTVDALQMGRTEEKGAYMTILCKVNGVKSENAVYQACSTEGCQKKVFMEHNEYRCEKCQKSSDTFKYNYMVQAEVFDCTGFVWVTMFSKAAEQLLGKSAQEMGELRESDPTAYDEMFQQIKFIPRVMRIRAKAETYNEEERIRYTVFDVSQPNFDQISQIYAKTLDALDKI